MTTTNEHELPVELDPKWLTDFCRRRNIVELGLFGSAARHELRPDSDFDFLVTFAPDAETSLLDLVEAKLELEDVLGREVDLIERRSLQNPYRRRLILHDLIPLYAV
jgi:predicted nucleotidyltransferase